MHIRTRVLESIITLMSVAVLTLTTGAAWGQNTQQPQGDAPKNPAPGTATVTTTPQVNAPAAPAKAPEPEAAPAPAAKGEEGNQGGHPAAMPSTSGNDMPSPRVIVPLTTTLGTGLFHTITTSINERVAMGIHLEWFSASDFLVDGHNEENTRLAGGLHLAFRLLPTLEMQIALYSSSNKNVRDREIDTYEPEVQRSLGDMFLGGKWAMDIREVKGLSLGFEGFAHLYTGIGGLSPDLSATAIGAILLASYDLRKSAGIALGIHMNLGYIHDNSYTMLESPDWANADANAVSELFYTYVVHRYAMGVMPSRAMVRLAFDYTHVFNVGGTALPITPFMEYTFLYFVDDDSNLYDIDQYLSVDTSTEADGSAAHMLTLGLAAGISKEVSLGLGVDLTLSQPGYLVAPSLPPYNVLATLTFVPQRATSSSPSACPVCKPREVIKEVVKEVPSKQQPQTGAIVGLIKDDKGNPVPGAAVSLPGVGLSDVLTDENGSFSTCQIKPNTYKVIAYKKGFEPAKAEIKVQAGKQAALTLVLKRKAAQTCKVQIVVKDAKRGRNIAASVKVRGKDKAGKDVSFEDKIPSGGKDVDLATGTYRLVFKARKHLTVSKELSFDTCPTDPVIVKLKRKPRKSYIKLNRRKTRILLRRKIYFKRNTARLTERSKIILDEIAAFLIEHPEIELVRIDGHTDNKGSDEYNKRLSQKRANAVRSYLISKGVEPSRLRAKGYGRSKPIYPNISERARAKNRRVEFHILKRRK